MSQRPITRTPRILAGQSVSEAFDVAGLRIEGIFLPAGFEGTSISFQACDTADGTYIDVYDESGDEVMCTAAASRFVGLDAAAAELHGLQFLRIRAGSTAAPTAQSGNRQLKVVTR